MSSLIWVAPRLQTDVTELKLIGDQLTAKYGKPYGLACREDAVGTVSTKLKQKLSVQAPPKLLVEKYLIEIAKMYNVDYEPDHKVILNLSCDFISVQSVEELQSKMYLIVFRYLRKLTMIFSLM